MKRQKGKRGPKRRKGGKERARNSSPHQHEPGERATMPREMKKKKKKKGERGRECAEVAWPTRKSPAWGRRKKKKEASGLKRAPSFPLGKGKELNKKKGA